MTHGHPDHADGAASLRELLGVPVYAWSRDGVPTSDRPLADGAVISVGTRRLRALYTPGHRFDHLCFLLEDARALFAGDLIAGVGTVVIAPPEGDLLDYLASLRRLQALDLRLILPAHGPFLDDPEAVLSYYIAHREERERQVLAALATGPQTVGELVERHLCRCQRRSAPNRRTTRCWRTSTSWSAKGAFIACQSPMTRNAGRSSLDNQWPAAYNRRKTPSLASIRVVCTRASTHR